MSVKNKFTITISDMHGSKHYLLHQVIKRFVLYFFLFIVFIIVSGSYLIAFLINSVDDLNDKRNQMISEQKVLKVYNDKLLAQIETKSQQYDEIKEKIVDIEALVGITPSLEIEIGERLKNIKFTAAQQKLIFDNIPNGHVIPFQGYTSKYGWRQHPILKRREFHRGIDLRAKKMTPIIAPADGVVEYAGYHKSNGYGYLVIIRHNYGFKTTYAHLSKKFPVKTGTFVKKGDIIAYTGNSGLSTGPHLHYEIHFATRTLDPKNFIYWDSSNFEEIFKKEKRVSWQSLINLIQARLHQVKQQ